VSATFDEIWAELRDWVVAFFADERIGSVRDASLRDSITVLAHVPNGRQQQMRISRVRVNPDDEWVELAAVVGLERVLGHRAALVQNQAVVGHFALDENGTYLYRHTLQMKYLAAPSDQFEVTLARMLSLSDYFEQQLTGQDNW